MTKPKWLLKSAFSTKQANTSKASNQQSASSLERDDLPVSIVIPIKCHFQTQVNPKFIAILQVKSDLPRNQKQIDFDAEPIFQISLNIPKVDAENTDIEIDLKGVGVYISRHLELLMKFSGEDFADSLLPRDRKTS